MYYMWPSRRTNDSTNTTRMCLHIIHSYKWIPFLIFPLSFFFLYVTTLSFIGQARQLDSSVSRTKETKWNRGRAVMSNSSYSVTYRPATVWGSLLETMEGSERSGALWSPSLIAFPGTGAPVLGMIVEWEPWVQGGGEGPPLRWPFTDTGGVEWKGLEEEEEEGSGRRGLLWYVVNVEVALNNTRPLCLCPPAGDFLTTTFSLLNYMF